MKDIDRMNLLSFKWNGPWTWLKIRTNKKKFVLGNLTQLLVASGQGDLARVKDIVDHGVDPNGWD